MNAAKSYFIQTIISGDMNRITYSKSKLKSTRSETRTQVWFTPREGLTKSEEISMKNDLKRGATFFTLREGFLFGAIYELGKLGTFEKVIK